MTNRFEKSIEDWYNSSRTADLKYLDLAQSPSNKDYLVTICNNTSVVFDRTCLLSKVTLKYFHKLEDQNRKLLESVKTLEQRIESLEKTLVQELHEIKAII